MDNPELVITRMQLERLKKGARNLSETIARIGYEDVLGEHLRTTKAEMDECEDRLRKLEQKYRDGRLTPEAVRKHIQELFVSCDDARHTVQAQALLADLIQCVTVSDARVEVALCVAFELQDEERTKVTYQAVQSLSRKELYERYPTEGFIQDEWRNMDQLMRMREKVVQGTW